MGEKPKLLVVDDDTDILTLAELALRQSGEWEVLSACTGQEGLHLARREQPHVVLLDFMMPDMDGSLALMHLKSMPETASIPVILMSALGTIRQLDVSLQSSVAGVIPKPFDPLTLSTSVKSIMEGSPGRTL